MTELQKQLVLTSKLCSELCLVNHEAGLVSEFGLSEFSFSYCFQVYWFIFSWIFFFYLCPPFLHLNLNKLQQEHISAFPLLFVDLFHVHSNKKTAGLSLSKRVQQINIYR